MSFRAYLPRHLQRAATLLVTLMVEAWQERPITESITFAELDVFIESEARAAGVNVNEAFPFRIECLPER